MLYDIRYNIDIYGHKAKRLALQRINGVSSNPVEGELKNGQPKNLISTLMG